MDKKSEQISHKRWIAPITPLVFVLITLGHLYHYPNLIHAATTVDSSTSVSAIVGVGLQRYSLFGYTSSFSKVLLEGIGVSQQTTADSKGYFEFIGFLAPIDSKEFCLVTVDTEELVAPPLCIPVPPQSAGRKIGPFLLPPTVGVSSGNIRLGTQAQVSGRTIPGTAISINTFAANPTQGAVLTFIQPVYAQTPGTSKKVYNTQSNSDGSFSLQLSSKEPEKIRLFAQAKFLGQKTPKSVTLTVEVFSFWVSLLLLLFGSLGPLLNLNTLLVLLLSIAAFLLYKRRSWFGLHKNKQRAITRVKHREIMLYKNKEIASYKEPEIAPYHKNELVK